MNTRILTKDKQNFPTVYSMANHSLASSSGKVEDDFEGKVKTRLMSMWNNMKYGTYYFYIIFILCLLLFI